MKTNKELLAKKKHIKAKSAKAKHDRVLGIHNPNAAGADIGATAGNPEIMAVAWQFFLARPSST